MTDHRELLDDDAAVERLLRRALADEAAEAPAGDLPGLAAGAAHRGRVHRRRSATLTAALSVVAVAAVAVAGTSLGRQHEATPPGDGSAPSLPSPTGAPLVPEDDGRPVLMFRGAEVPVPAGMLDPTAVQCGTAVRDAAYVVDETLPVDQCEIDIDQSGITTVTFEPVEQVPADEQNPGGFTLDDGRYRVSSALPLSDVWLTVTSPDKKRADRIFGSVQVLATPNGCPLHPDPAPVPGSGSDPIRLDVGPGLVGHLCGYRDGWVTGARVLSPTQTTMLADLVEAAPNDATADYACSERNDGGWWLHLGDQSVWVGGGCPQVVASSGGSAMATDTLVSALWFLATGPATFDHVLSSKD